MFGREETNDILKLIFTKQCEILTELQSIDSNIVKYFGEECDLREKVLKEKVKNARFTSNQLEVVKELMGYAKEKHSEKDGVDDLEN